MNAQARDLVCAMVDADSVPCNCDICGDDLDGNSYGPFATVCRDCSDNAS